MAGYSDIRELIISTLTARPEGVEIQPLNHQEFALQITDYVRSVELVAGGAVPIAFATSDTVPVQPNIGNAVYLARVPCATTITFNSFKNNLGDSISITSQSNEVKLVTLLWNGKYWSSQETSVYVITDTDSGYIYKGIISSLTLVPSVITVPSFYIAALSGTYVNFNNLTCEVGEVAIFKSNDNGVSWIKETTNVASKNSVFSENNLANNSVTADKIANNSVTADKIANNSVTADKIANSIKFAIAGILNLSQSGNYFSTLSDSLTISYSSVSPFLKKGGYITFATDSSFLNWKTYQYVGSDLTQEKWCNIENWRVVLKTVVKTEEEYEALIIKDADTLYFVTEI